MIFDKFKDARALASPRLRAGVLTAELRNAERSSHFIDDGFRKFKSSSLLDPVQNSGFSPWTLFDLAIKLTQF
jgi:hypothetical protein